jgi:colanic acid/amylovoran biosynthesis glycosyltransferase
MISMFSFIRESEVQSASRSAISGPRLGYLVSRYPAVSHTFILREVLELRKLGFCIETASINRPDRKWSELPRVEQLEAQSTVCIKDEGMLRAMSAMLRLFSRRPRSFFRALLFSMGLGNGSAREIVTSIFYFAEAALLGDWLERRRLKHLHVHFANAASTVAMIAARAYPITFSLTVHGPDEFYEVDRHALRQKMESALFVCCIGSYARSQLMKVSDPSAWPKYRLAPLGVDPAEFRVGPLRRNPPRWEILCVGRLTPAKGQMILLQALKTLLAEGRSFHCRFVGDGPDRAMLTRFAARELPAETVTFQGSVNADRIHDYLGRADIFVLPSFAEGVPVSLMEAMSMEIPCVSTIVAGIPELIRHGIDGLLVSPSDEIELASAVALLMDDEDLRRSLGAAGRERVIARYNLQDNVRALAEIMKCELINS